MRRIGRAGLALLAPGVAALLLLAALLPPSLPVPPRRSLVISGVTVINPGIERLPGQSLVIRAGRIVAVRPHRDDDPAPLCADCFAVPGLVDAHVHSPPRVALGNQALFALLYLAYGVTTVRDVGASDGSIGALAGRLERAELPGPRLLRCGPVLDGAPPSWPMARVVRGAGEAAALVGELADEGVDCIKVYDELGPAAFAAAATAARDRGLALIGHVPHAVGLRGVFDFEAQHMTGVPYLHRPRPPHGVDLRDEDVLALGAGEIEEALAVARAQEVAFTPTLANFGLRLTASDPARFVPSPGTRFLPAFWARAWDVIAAHPSGELAIERRLALLSSLTALVRRADQLGIPILAGTDTIMPFVVPGEALHLELAALAEALGSGEAALAAATTVNGRRLASGEIGVIRAGARADLLLLREDPTRSLAALRDWQILFADGRRYERATVDGWLERYRRHFRGALYESVVGTVVGIAVDGFRAAAPGPPEPIPAGPKAAVSSRGSDPENEETPMPIDPNAVGLTGGPVRRSWTSKDALLYALGVGAGVDELAFTTENTKDTPQRVLPTMAVILGGGGIPFDKLGTFNPALMLHGGEGIELFDEIPPEGEIESTGKIAAIWDKGKAASVDLVSESINVATGKPLFRVKMTSFFRGEGGWGGERGPASTFQVPSRKPDHEVRYPTRIDQALIYRLSGDRNPLHSDPAFAKMGGFPRPILHGLCTYGFTGRALLHTLCGGDPKRFKAMEGRFSKPVMPGDELTVVMWVDGGTCLFQTKNQDGDVVFDQGVMKFA